MKDSVVCYPSEFSENQYRERLGCGYYIYMCTSQFNLWAMLTTDTDKTNKINKF